MPKKGCNGIVNSSYRPQMPSTLLPAIPYVGMEGYIFSLSGYRYLGDGGPDRHESLLDGTY